MAYKAAIKTGETTIVWASAYQSFGNVSKYGPMA